MSSPPGGEDMPFLGSKINLISMSEIRYEGFLVAVDPQASTVSLTNVKSYGTEDRPTDAPVPPSNEIYNCIVFQGKHIKDLTVCEDEPSMLPSCLPDPAIVSIEVSGSPCTEDISRRGVSSAAKANSKPSSSGRADRREVSASERKGGDEACAQPLFSSGGRPETGNRGLNAVASASDSIAGEGGVSGGRAASAYPNYTSRAGGVGGRGREASHRGGHYATSSSRGRGATLRGSRAARNASGTSRPGRGDGEVVGELQGQVNQQLKSELAEDFDFDAMNSKFLKSESDKASGKRASKIYDKNKSFFDSLSCEALERKAMPELADGERGGRASIREQRRVLDVDTFGESAAYYNVQYATSRRGRGRGRGGRGGGGLARGGGGGGGGGGMVGQQGAGYGSAPRGGRGSLQRGGWK